MAEKAYDAAKSAGYRKRNFNHRDYVLYRYTDLPSLIDNHTIAALLISSRGSLQKPKRSGLDIRPVTKTAILSIDGNARMVLRNQDHLLDWAVAENNHACEHAREHPVVDEMFRLLSKIRWTAKTGGRIVGNDEYNRSDVEYGGGANYVKYEFGLTSNNVTRSG